MKYLIAVLIIFLVPASASAEFKLYAENEMNYSEFGVSIDDQKDSATLIAMQGGPSLEAAFCAAFLAISEFISTSISNNSRETNTKIAGFEVNAEYAIEENGQKTNMTEIVQISDGISILPATRKCLKMAKVRSLKNTALFKILPLITEN